MNETDFKEIERRCIPGSGSCGGMYTANTMSSSFEALGMSLLYSSTQANPDQEKVDSTAEAARVLVDAIRNNLLPSDIITRKSIENAVSLIMAVGGSTNAVLHFLAIAHSAGIPWTIDDFETIRRRVPVLCDLKPSGRYVATDLHAAGGVPQVMRMLLDHGLLHGDAMTITGQSIAEVLAHVHGLDENVLMRNLSGPLNVVRGSYRLLQFDGVQWVGSQRISLYRFRHILFQSYLYEQMDAAERSLAEVLETGKATGNHYAICMAAVFQGMIFAVRGKLRQARQMIDASGFDIRLEIDGGVKADNIAEIKAAGADTFVSGSGLFGYGKAEDPHRYDTIVRQMRAALASVGG